MRVGWASVNEVAWWLGDGGFRIDAPHANNKTANTTGN